MSLFLIGGTEPGIMIVCVNSPSLLRQALIGEVFQVPRNKQLWSPVFCSTWKLSWSWMLGLVEEYLGGGVQLSLDNRDRLVTSSRVPGTKSYFVVMWQVSPSSRHFDFSTTGKDGLKRRSSTSSFSSSSLSLLWIIHNIHKCFIQCNRMANEPCQ